MRIPLIAAAVCAALSSPAGATAPGDIDLGFGAGGVRAVAFDLAGDKQDIPYALIEIYPYEGQMAAVGASRNVDQYGTYRVGAVAVLDRDGELLTQFDGDGRATFSYNPGYDTVFTSAAPVPVDPGLFFLGGFTHSYQDNGVDHSAAYYSMDIAGGTWSVHSPPEEIEVSALAHDADSRVYAAGSAGNAAATDFYVTRMFPDSSLDGNFAPNGYLRIGFDLNNGPHVDYATAVAAYPGGGAVVAGNAQYDGADYDFAVVKLTDDGEPDPTFSGDGKANVHFDLAGGNKADRVTAVGVDRIGRIIVAGTASRSADGSDTDVAVVRLTREGLIDTSFGNGGKLVASFDAGDPTRRDELAAMLIQRDGRIWLLGTRWTGDPGNQSNIALMRLTKDGDVDTSFGLGDGVVYYGFSQGSPGGRDVASALMMQSDGKLVLLGSKEKNGADTDFVLTRVFNDFDPSDFLFDDGFEGL